MSRKPSTRRGAALLIVLATLVMVVTATVGVARMASTTKSHRLIAERTMIADDLLDVAERPILDWLARESTQVVLPPDVTTPVVTVLHDVWQDQGARYQLQITAWDQCGMAPILVGRSGSPLRLAVPFEVLHLLDRLSLRRNETAGLDLFVNSARSADGIDVFPEPELTEPQLFDVANLDNTSTPAADTTASWESADRVAIGAHIATHNPGRVNVNTAPIELVRQAMRQAGRGGLDQIIDARSEGQRATLVGGPGSEGDGRRGGNQGRSTLQLAGDSTAWAFRIDIGVGLPRGGAVRRSWWAVYVLAEESSWECVQRLAILD